VKTEVNIKTGQYAGKEIEVDLIKVNRKTDKRSSIQDANVKMNAVGSYVCILV